MAKKLLLFLLSLTICMLAVPALASDYMGNSHSMKFHYTNCRTIKHANAAYWVHFNTRDEAVAAGYTPCGVCKP